MKGIEQLDRFDSVLLKCRITYAELLIRPLDGVPAFLANRITTHHALYLRVVTESNFDVSIIDDFSINGLQYCEGLQVDQLLRQKYPNRKKTIIQIPHQASKLWKDYSAIVRKYGQDKYDWSDWNCQIRTQTICKELGWKY